MRTITVDPAALQEMGNTWMTTGETLTRAYNTLREVVDTQHAMCGTDLHSKKIGETYYQSGQKLIDALADVCSGIHSGGYGITVSAHNYSAAESSSNINHAGTLTGVLPLGVKPTPIAHTPVPDPRGGTKPSPGIWGKIIDFITDQSDYPNGDSTKIRAVADAYTTARGSLTEAKHAIKESLTSLDDMQLPEKDAITQAVTAITNTCDKIDTAYTQTSQLLNDAANYVSQTQQAIDKIIEDVTTFEWNPIKEAKKLLDLGNNICNIFSQQFQLVIHTLQEAIIGLSTLNDLIDDDVKKLCTRVFTSILGEDLGTTVGSIVSERITFDIDLGFGLGQGVLGLGEGIVGLADLALPNHMIKLQAGVAGHIFNRLKNGQFYELLSDAGNTGKKFAIDTIKENLDTKEWGTRPGRAVGQGVVNIGSLFLGAGEAKAAGILGKPLEEGALNTSVHELGEGLGTKAGEGLEESINHLGEGLGGSENLGGDLGGDLGSGASENLNHLGESLGGDLGSKVDGLGGSVEEGVGNGASENLNHLGEGLGGDLGGVEGGGLDHGLGSDLGGELGSKVDGLGGDLGSKVDGLGSNLGGDLGNGASENLNHLGEDLGGNPSEDIGGGVAGSGLGSDLSPKLEEDLGNGASEGVGSHAGEDIGGGVGEGVGSHAGESLGTDPNPKLDEGIGGGLGRDTGEGLGGGVEEGVGSNAGESLGSDLSPKPGEDLGGAGEGGAGNTAEDLGGNTGAGFDPDLNEHPSLEPSTAPSNEPLTASHNNSASYEPTPNHSNEHPDSPNYNTGTVNAPSYVPNSTPSHTPNFIHDQKPSSKAGTIEHHTSHNAGEHAPNYGDNHTHEPHESNINHDSHEHEHHDGAHEGDENSQHHEHEHQETHNDTDHIGHHGTEENFDHYNNENWVEKDPNNPDVFPPNYADPKIREQIDRAINQQKFLEDIQHNTTKPPNELAEELSIQPRPLPEGALDDIINHNPYQGLTRDDIVGEYVGHKVPGQFDWPEHYGFTTNEAGEPVHTEERSFIKGEKLDRIGKLDGDFGGSPDDRYNGRSLAPGTNGDYYEFEGTDKPLPDKWVLWRGHAAPAFGQPGGAVQWCVYDEKQNALVHISELLKKGYIRGV